VLSLITSSLVSSSSSSSLSATTAAVRGDEKQPTNLASPGGSSTATAATAVSDAKRPGSSAGSGNTRASKQAAVVIDVPPSEEAIKTAAMAADLAASQHADAKMTELLHMAITLVYTSVLAPPF
jgi:hypothetical protein